jgi:hypothetical protein
MLTGLRKFTDTPSTVSLDLGPSHGALRSSWSSPCLVQRPNMSHLHTLRRTSYGFTSSSGNSLFFITFRYRQPFTVTIKVWSACRRTPHFTVVPNTLIYISISSAKPLPRAPSSSPISQPRAWWPTFSLNHSLASNLRSYRTTWTLSDHVCNEGEC